VIQEGSRGIFKTNVLPRVKNEIEL